MSVVVRIEKAFIYRNPNSRGVFHEYYYRVVQLRIFVKLEVGKHEGNLVKEEKSSKISLH